MPVDQPVNEARSFAEPLQPSLQGSHAVSLAAARAICALYRASRENAIARVLPIGTNPAGRGWEDAAFAVLALSGTAGVVLAFGAVM